MKKVHIFVVKFLLVFAYRFLHRHYGRQSCHLRTFTLHNQCLKRIATRKMVFDGVTAEYIFYFELQLANIFFKSTVTDFMSAQGAEACENKVGPSKLQWWD